MKRIGFIAIVLLNCLFAVHSANAQKVTILDLNTPIYKATADYIHAGLKQASEDNSVCVILRINTPGGLLDATRKIVGDITASPIPVIAFVSPSGAHAGSAGAFVALSAHLTVMSPGTNIGAAHPVLSQGQPDSIMNKKITEDAVAFIRSIAEIRGRDPRQLIEIVTNSKSFSAEEAVKHKIADFLAPNTNALIDSLNGRRIIMDAGHTVTLATKGAESENLEMSAKDRFLNTLNDPNIMYLLLLAGIMGLIFEFFNPGGLAPGIIGVVCLLLAGYGMSLLPLNFTGLALIVTAIILFVLEIKFPSHALLSISGVICLFLGSLFLINRASSADVVHISWSVLITSVLITGAFFIFLVGLGLKAQKSKVVTGKEGLIGLTGIAMEDLNPFGRVRVNGEFWDSISESKPISKGEHVIVTQINDFQLTVKSILSNQSKNQAYESRN